MEMPEDSLMQAEMTGSLMGALVGNFFLPVGAAIYYSRKFPGAQQAASNEPQS